MIPSWLNISHSLDVITQALSLLKCFSSLLSHSRHLLALSWPTELIYYIILFQIFSICPSRSTLIVSLHLGFFSMRLTVKNINSLPGWLQLGRSFGRKWEMRIKPENSQLYLPPCEVSLCWFLKPGQFHTCGFL